MTRPCLLMCAVGLAALVACVRTSPGPAATSMPPHELRVTTESNGLVAVSVVTPDGVANGASITINCDTKNVMSRGQASGGQNTGPWKYCYPDGRLAVEGAFLRGSNHGVWKNWNPKGVLVSEETFVEGQREGKCSYWDDEGKPDAARSGTYRAGSLQK